MVVCVPTTALHCGSIYIKHVVEVSCAAAQGKVLVNALLNFIYWLVQYMAMFGSQSIIGLTCVEPKSTLQSAAESLH